MSHRVACALAVLALVASQAAAKDEPVNLLRLPSAKAESTTTPGGDASALAALTDGDPASVAEAAATETGPLDVVYGFGEATVAPEGVRVTLPEKGASAARVEILVSTVSAHAGFRSLRTDPLTAGAKPETFAFPPTAARWILVRLIPAHGAKSVAAAEVEVLGREGTPQSHYAFSESPAKAFDVLQRLEKTTSLKLSVTDDEKAMFAKAKAGRLDRASFDEAALLASGVLDAAKRKQYVKRLDELEKQARAAIGGASTPAAKADALLQWLHKVPMAKGYVSEQTDLSTVLDTATFNCVSSATLFNSMALRLGLDVRAIEVPDHAFSILYEGTNHMDVETTTAMGFNPARDQAAAASFEKLTGFRYIPDAHRDQRREIEEAGLAAIIYYNHGVTLSREKRYHEALLANFRAMSLDPEFDSAVKNALGVLATWGADLSREGKFQDALDVVATGLALAPKDAALVNNHAAIWSQWAMSAIDTGKADEAIAILKRAAAAVPDGGFTDMQAWVYLKPGEARVRDAKWEEALAVTEPGLAKLDAGPREEVAKWRVELYLRWFNAEVGAGRFEESAKVIEKGRAAAPKDDRFPETAGYLAQEWSNAVGEKEGEAKAIEVLKGLKTRFAGVAPVAEAASNHVRRTASRLADADKPEEALAAIQAGRDLVADAQETEVYIYDTWAKRHAKAGEWEKAADVYAKAMALYPKDGLLSNNVAWLAQEWTKAAYEKGGADAAAEVAKAMAAKFPGLEAASKTGGDQLRRAARDLVEQGKYDEALAAVEKGKGLLQGEEEVEELCLYVYGTWARTRMKAGEWEKAAEVDEKALGRFPKSSRVREAIAYLTQEWSEDAAKSGKAGEVLRGMLKRFPGLEEVAKAAANHVSREVSALAKAGKHDEALAAIEASKDLLAGDDGVKELAEYVYDTWAIGLSKEQKWQEALDAYAGGLKRFPGDDHLKGNAVATWDEWARTFMDKKDWDGAIGIYTKGQAQFPDESLFGQNIVYCKEQKGK